MRLAFAIVICAPLGCKAGVVTEFTPDGVYSGPVTLDDTSVLVTDVDEAVLAVIFTDCAGDTCADVSLDGTIETALGDIADGTMPVEELELSGRQVTGKLQYGDGLYGVKGTFLDDGLTLNAKISLIGHVMLDFTPDELVDE